ncbi:MAG: MFS transporter [Clostridia bacterium]|nr:MFS transporter [Clostridia bacterium]
MKKNKLFAYFCCIVIFYLGANFAHPVTPTLIVERNLDSSMFGVALAAMMFVNFLFSPLWGKLCMYIPTRLIMLVCGIGYAVGQMIFGAATTEVMVVGGRMFAGIFTGGMFTAFSNYVVNTSLDQTQRGKNLTILVTVQNVASAVGYFIGGMMGLVSVEFTFTCQIISLIIVGVLFYICCEDDTPYKHKPEKKLTLKDANPFAAFLAAKHFMTPMLFLIFAVVAVAGIGQNSFEQCFNYYIKDQFNMTSAYNGIFKAAIAIASLIANATLCLWMQKKTDTNKSFMPLMAVQTVFLAIVLINSSITSFVICDVMFFALNAVRMPLLQNMVAMRTTPENSNQVMGFYQAMNSLGSIFGALFAGLIYDANPMLPFILAVIAFGAATIIGMAYVGKYKKSKN